METNKKVNGSVRFLASDWSGVMSDDRKPAYEADMRMLDVRRKERIPFDVWISQSRANPVDFLADMGVRGDPGILLTEYSNLLIEVKKEGTVPFTYSDSKRFLEFLRGREIPVIVVSSHPEDHLRKEAAAYGLDGYISAFIGGVADKSVAIAKACSTVGIETSSSAYLGDMVYDIWAAKRSGVRSLAVSTGYHDYGRLAAEKPDILVRSLTELEGRLAKLLDGRWVNE